MILTICWLTLTEKKDVDSKRLVKTRFFLGIIKKYIHHIAETKFQDFVVLQLILVTQINMLKQYYYYTNIFSLCRKHNVTHIRPIVEVLVRQSCIYRISMVALYRVKSRVFHRL